MHLSISHYGLHNIDVDGVYKHELWPEILFVFLDGKQIMIRESLAIDNNKNPYNPEE